MTIKYQLIGGNVVAIEYTIDQLSQIDASPQERRPSFLAESDALVVSFLASKPTAKAQAWTRIKTERDRRKTGGFKVGSLWYHSDEASRGQYSILLSMAVEKSIPVGTALSPAWKDMAGNFAPMTVALLRQIRDAGLVLEQQLFTTAETHRAAMEASADPASYDFSTGWPAAFTA